MLTHRLIYISNKAPNLVAEDISSILESARISNQNNGVTGMLIVTRKMFIQALEGEEEAVRAVFSKIKKDPRHSDIRVIVDAKAPARAFPIWSMGFSEQSEEILRGQAASLGIMSKDETYNALNTEPSIATSLLAKLSAADGSFLFNPT